MVDSTFPSLASMATRMAGKEVKQITDLKDMEWHLAKPILEQVTNAQQLLNLQMRSPQFAEHTGYLWKKLIERDVVNADKYVLEPPSEDLWWKVYRKLKKLDEKEKRRDMASLARDLAALTKEKVDNRVQFVAMALPSTDQEGATRRKITRDQFPDLCAKSNKPHSKFFQKIAKEQKELAIARGQIKDPRTRLPGMSSAKQVPIRYNTQTWHNQDHYQTWGAGIGKKEEQFMVDNYLKDHKERIKHEKESSADEEIASRYITRRKIERIAPGKNDLAEKQKSPPASPPASPPKEDTRYVMPELGDELPAPFKPEELAQGIRVDTSSGNSKPVPGPSNESGAPSTLQTARVAASPKKRPPVSIFIEPKRQRRA